VAGPSGWLTVCGLIWLSPSSEYTIGSNPTSSSNIFLPSKNIPSLIGRLKVQEDNDTVKLVSHNAVGIFVDGREVEPSQEVELIHDAKGKPTIVCIGNNGAVSFFILKRGQKLAVRVKDKENDKLLSFKGIDGYPYNPSCRVTAKLLPHEKVLTVPNILGDLLDYQSPGSLEFTSWVDGKRYTLDAVVNGNHLWMIFQDATSDHETYRMRFLYTSLPGDDNTTVLDFNLAETPACAFTAFAACPLPPKQNILPFQVDAGEKTYAGGEH